MSAEKLVLQQANVAIAVRQVAEKIEEFFAAGGPVTVYGIPRGGVAVAYALAATSPRIHVAETPQQAMCIVDDIIDSGETARRYARPGRPLFALYAKSPLFPKDSWAATITDRWVVFPWEGSEEGSADDIPRRLLQYIGEDVERGGLLETPRRFLSMWKEMTSGYAADPEAILKSFEDGAAGVDEMVVVRDIKFYSQCEHHLVPFFGVAHVGYVPNGKIVGLSKIPRLVDIFARRLQVQERMTQQIADTLNKVLAPKGVIVVTEARHLCMEARGARCQGSTTTSSALHGVLKKEAARAEFFAIIARRMP